MKPWWQEFIKLGTFLVPLYLMLKLVIILAIWKSHDVLVNGCRWKIGDGSKIKIMPEPWLRTYVERITQGCNLLKLR
ncbi:hypothetical protein A2U01_0038645, partial [Trifolium medium]|nr:hypothetical protein [Trifolium medium]